MFQNHFCYLPSLPTFVTASHCVLINSRKKLSLLRTNFSLFEFCCNKKWKRQVLLTRETRTYSRLKTRHFVQQKLLQGFRCSKWLLSCSNLLMRLQSSSWAQAQTHLQGAYQGYKVILWTKKAKVKGNHEYKEPNLLHESKLSSKVLVLVLIELLDPPYQTQNNIFFQIHALRNKNLLYC